LTLKLDKGSPALELQLNLDGYRSEKRTIVSDLNREIDVNLLKAAGRRGALPKPAAAARPGDARPSDTRSSDSKPVEAKPAATKPPKDDKPTDPDKELIPAQL
ncbi:MAG: hypothetical protein JWM53_6320, partial [bacterium]|nr:hypothetical protein [bacterium]